MWDHLNHPLGVVPNVSGIDSGDVDRACISFLTSFFSEYCKVRSADRLLFKTPDDIRFLEDMLHLFPDAYYIHITRDGRDVTLSTMSRHRNLRGYGEASAFNCLQRWTEFETRLRERLPQGYRYISLTYESLVQIPEQILRQIVDFLGL